MAKIPASENTAADPTPGASVTTTGISPVQNTAAPGSSKVKLEGSEQADRVSFNDIFRDSDHVIKTLGGDDIFNFNGSESRLPINAKINGIVDFGDGIDTVFLGFQKQDYDFTLRYDKSGAVNGVKVQYVGHVDLNGDGVVDRNDVDGAAVTFQNSELFTFRGFSSDGGVKIEDETLTVTDLIAQILATQTKEATFS